MTDLRKNQYEEIIDQMMIDEVAGIDDDLRETLNGLDVKKKRRAILSILDKDRGLFSRINKLLTQGVGVNKTEYITEVVTMLRDYVKVGHVEKKKFGEVMTPIWLVEEMLNKLPAEVWSNPSLKWLDSCNGVGIFPSVVVKRLMAGLVGFEPDEELRYKHIVEKMIYVGELQPKNMFLFLCSFDPKDEYDLNVYTGSFLDASFDTHMKNVWGIEKFDIIVGNPPYQDFQNANGKRGGGSSLWDKFVLKYLTILVECGYLVAVHPAAWRNIDGKMKNVQRLLKGKLQYLEIHNEKDGLKTFGASTRYDWYVLKNETTNSTVVMGEDGVAEIVDLAPLEFIPSAMFTVIDELVAKNGMPTIEVLHSYSAYESRKDWMSVEQIAPFIHQCAHNIDINGVVNSVLYTSKNDNGHFGIPKVIFGSYGVTSYIDAIGEFGLTQHCSAIVDNVETLKSINDALHSPAFKTLMSYCYVGGIRFTINYKFLSLLRKEFWKEFVNEPVTETTDAA